VTCKLCKKESRNTEMAVDNEAKNIEKVIGVISDTHGLLRPEAVETLRGVDLILHAGDVGSAEVLETLKGIAPVIAVRGNNDKGAWAEELPHWEVAEVGAVSIYMIHDVKEIDLSSAAAGFQVVVSGHSHKPSVEERKGVLYVNPGSAGPRRFSLPISVARLKVGGEVVIAELIELVERRKS
jgi:putative phosphoesterase